MNSFEHPVNCRCSVKIKHLGVRKGTNLILHDVFLDVRHGEILALIGRNGAGKSTLIKAVLGRIPHTGEVLFFSCEGKPIAKPRIGYVPQTLSFDHSTPVTVSDLFCANNGDFPVWLGHKRKQLARAESLLDRVGAGRLLHKSLGALSGGELQRVLLAFALDPMPDLLLLDEPVSALDRKGAGVFYELVCSLRSELQMPIILVSHDLGHVRKYATSAALIDRTVLLHGRPDAVLAHPKVREIFGLELSGGEA